jgi:predicted DNA-binding transcriptional regulator AlpA
MGVRSEQTARPPPIGITVSQAVELSGLSRSFVWLLIKTGRLRTTSVGRRRIVLFQSLLELLGAK